GSPAAFAAESHAELAAAAEDSGQRPHEGDERAKPVGVSFRASFAISPDETLQSLATYRIRVCRERRARNSEGEGQSVDCSLPRDPAMQRCRSECDTVSGDGGPVWR